MPGLLKVGVTDESPSARLPNLHTTGVPTPFVLEACVRVIDSAQAEKRVHELLAQSRPTSNREFFQVTLGDALARCLPHLKEFLVSGHKEAETSPTWSLPTDEEKILRLIAQRMNQPRKLTKAGLQRELNISAMTAKLLLGNLIKRRFVRELSEERESQHDNRHGSYKVRVLEVERAGIQYLLDNRWLTREQL